MKVTEHDTSPAVFTHEGQSIHNPQQTRLAGTQSQPL